MITFFSTIKQSIYDPAFYRDLPSKPFSFSIKYLLKLALLGAVFLCIFGSIKYIPIIRNVANTIGEQARETYPADLVIKVKDGQLTSNQQEPYFIKTPASMRSGWKDEKQYANLAVIDTQTPFSTDQFEKYDTLSWILKSDIVVSDGDLQTRIVSIKDMPDAIVDKEFIIEITGKIKRFVDKFVLFATPATMFIIGFLFVAVKLIYLVFAALLVWGLLAFMRHKMTYGTSFRIALHAMTLPLLGFGIIKLYSGWTQPFFVFSLILLVIVVLNQKTGDSTVVSVVSNDGASGHS